MRPNTTRPAPGHKIYPSLLRNMTIDRPNQVWAADITYLPIGRGFLYLVAIIDWASGAVLAWRLSNTMDALAGAGINISMDGRGRWMDNVFIERLWRSLKHEDIVCCGGQASA
ncbi:MULTISPECIES: IS3 family transposase [Bradyrhizobium]|uniref:IS3 family transposase n=1 Tax=Bradyrhizobium TaxID=374 RepID=UPI0004B7CA28|nr:MULTISPECIES: IS3 family transposase [Bradyrhizobium]